MVGAGGYLGSYGTAPDEQHAGCGSRMHRAAGNRFEAVPFPAGVRSQPGSHLSNRLSSPDSRGMPYDQRHKSANLRIRSVFRNPCFICHRCDLP